MFTEEFFELLLDFGDEWEVKRVETNLGTSEVDIYVEYVGQMKMPLSDVGDIFTQWSLRHLLTAVCHGLRNIMERSKRCLHHEESEAISRQWYQLVKHSRVKEVIKVAEMFSN